MRILLSQKPIACRNFLLGKCTRGAKCHFLHTTVTTTNLPVLPMPTTPSTSRKRTAVEQTVQVSNHSLATSITPHVPTVGRRRNRARIGERKPSKTIAELELAKESKLLALTACIVNKGVNVLNDNINLTPSELAVLSCGFSFIPPPNHKRKWSDDLIRDYNSFERNIRIKYLFKDDTNTQKLNAEKKLHIFVNKQKLLRDSTNCFTPPKASVAVELYLNHVKNNLAKLSTDTTEKTKARSLRNIHNHWKHFYDTTAKLKARKDIVIYPADKNMGPSVLTREFYITEGESVKHLGDITSYTPLDPTSVDIQNRYARLHTIMSNQTWLSKKEATKLYENFTFNKGKEKPCNAYFLPKVHKKDLALRLICASCSWLTYLPSKYIAYTLQPILKSLPSYIDDSATLVRILENIQTSVYDQLVTADVIALYPSIVIEDGLRSLKDTLYQKGLDKEQIKFILELTSWVLHNNVLTFNGKLYLQIKGTAMGTPLAVAYACIHMHVIEQESFHIFASRGYSLRNVRLFVRFIDDIYFIATTYDHAKLLLDIINDRRPSIKLEFKVKNSSVDFLDITIYKADKTKKLQVKLYEKPGNKHLFLPPMSFHPPHIFKGWITGYIQRMRLRSTVEREFHTVLTNYKTSLENRGYTKRHLDKPFSLLPDRQVLLTTTAKHVDKGTLFITTYTVEVAENKAKLIQALTAPKGLELHPDIEFILDGRNRPMLSLKREKNLREMLVSAKLPTIE